MKRNTEAEPGITETRHSHKAFGLQKNKSAGIIDAEAWISRERRRRISALQHQEEVIVA